MFTIISLLRLPTDYLSIFQPLPSRDLRQIRTRENIFGSISHRRSLSSRRVQLTKVTCCIHGAVVDIAQSIAHARKVHVRENERVAFQIRSMNTFVICAAGTLSRPVESVELLPSPELSLNNKLPQRSSALTANKTIRIFAERCVSSSETRLQIIS